MTKRIVTQQVPPKIPPKGKREGEEKGEREREKGRERGRERKGIKRRGKEGVLTSKRSKGENSREAPTREKVREEEEKIVDGGRANSLLYIPITSIPSRH